MVIYLNIFDFYWPNMLHLIAKNQCIEFKQNMSVVSNSIIIFLLVIWNNTSIEFLRHFLSDDLTGVFNIHIYYW